MYASDLPRPRPADVVALAVLLVLLLPGCGPAPAEEAASPSPASTVVAEHASHAAPAPPAASAEPAALPGGSVYHLDSEWRDRTGAVRPLRSLAGRVQVAAMVYTRCAATCPLIVGELKRIERAAEAERPGGAGLVLVSLDPARDTPERLREFADGAGLDPARWTLLAGGDDDVLELAAVLGVRYRAGDAGEIAHSNVLVVLDREGEVAHRQEGLGEGRAETIRVVRGLLRE